MEIVIAGVVVALGLVVAAALLGKRGPARGAATERAQAPQPRNDAAKAAAQAGRLEERLHGREEALDSRAAELAERERALAVKESEIAEIREQAVRQLERASGLPASQAKALLMKELEAALALLQRRFPDPPATPRELERALGMLVRKGYELELAHDALRRYAGADELF